MSPTLGLGGLWKLLLLLTLAGGLHCLAEARLLSKCPPGWLHRASSDWCYQASDSAASFLTWREARKACKVQGADLLWLADAEEQKWLAQRINAYEAGDRFWWIGLSRHSGGGGGGGDSWTWEGGNASAAAPQPWEQGSSDVIQGDCMAMYRQDLGSGTVVRFWPRDCGFKSKYLCKKPGKKVTDCDAEHGWHLVNNRCYKVYTAEGDSGLDWEEARSKCNAEESDLATVPNQAAGTAIRSLLPRASNSGGQHYWLGLRTQLDPSSPSGFVWRWADGSPLIYEAWSTGTRPSVQRERATDTCTHALASGEGLQWKDYPCKGARFGYVCARPPGACPTGWYQHRETCYSIHLTEMSWDEADMFCWLRGGSLIQVKRRHIQDFINTYKGDFAKRGVAYIWIGLYQATSSHKLAWTAAGEAADDDGFLNWAAGEPSLSQARPNAARVLAFDEQGRWQAANPVERGGFACELPLGQAPKVPAAELPRFHCISGWMLYGRSCYRLFAVPNTWVEARFNCRSQPGGELVDIRDAAEQEFIQWILEGGRSFWIGLQARGSPADGRWLWSADNTPASYYNWQNGSPTPNSDASCVEINPAGKWSNLPCHSRSPSICKIPADLGGVLPTVAPTTSSSSDPFCDPLWTRDLLSNYCYLFNTDPMKWLEAKHLCEQQGGKLLSVASEQENSFLLARVQEVTSENPAIVNFWTSFTDRATEGRWVWDDGEPVPYLNWAPGEPDNAGDGEDCAVIHPPSAQWFDSPCQRRYASICKKLSSAPQTQPTVATTSSVPGDQLRGCRDGYTGFNGMCYRVFGAKQDAVTWDEARERCHAEGGGLASVTGPAEHQFLLELSRRQGQFTFWIGLYNRISMQRAMQFQWADRSPVTYTSWHTGKPSSYNVNEVCVEIFNSANEQNGNWNDISCSTARPFACKQRQVPVRTRPPVTPIPGCPAAYDDAYGGHCLKFVAGIQRLNGRAAQRKCRFLGGTLATIPDEGTQNHFFVRITELQAKSDFWIGLTRNGTSFQWDDGRPVTYTKWRAGESHVGIRASMSAQTGKWQMSSSQITAHMNYVCQRDQHGGVTTPFPTRGSAASFCPQGWIEADDSCYKGFGNAPHASDRLTWSKARAQCRKVHGDLATIYSSRDLAALSQTFRGTAPYWIGLNTLDSSHGFVWANGRPARLFKWRGGKEPGSANTGRNCAQLHPDDMTWSMENCSVAQNWLCEIQKSANLTIV